MANYAGKITVEEGAFMVSGSGDLGTTAGATEVKPGATLIIYTGPNVEGSAAGDGLDFQETIAIAGTGDEQWGAAVYQAVGESSQQKALHYLDLSADATIFSGTQLGTTGGRIAMAGNKLTLKGGRYCINRSRIRPVEERPGDIEVATGTLMLNSYVSGDFGSPDKTVTVRDGAMVSLYDAQQVPLWKLVVDEGGSFQVQGKNAAVNNTWGGDVEWNSTLDKSLVLNSGMTLTIKGNVTGTGKMYANCGTVVFEKDVSIDGFDVSGTAVVNLPSSDRYWGHGGMMIGHRADNWPAGFDQNRSDTAWSYCALGPGPQVDRSYWAESGKECWCSRGYIWNRGDADVTWTLFCGGVYENWIIVDGVQVSYNKRDSWGSGKVTLTPGPHAIDIRTSNGDAYGGPRTDNDKFKIDNVISFDSGNGYLFTTDTVDRATVLLEHSHKLSNIARAGSSVLDAGGMPVEITNFTGVPEVANALACTLKGVWTLTAADINAGKALSVPEGAFTFDNVTIAIDDVDAIAHANHAWRHVICTAAAPIAGIQADVVFQGAKRTWKLVLSDDGKELALEYQPKGMTVIVE